MPLYIAKSGDQVLPMPDWLTDSLTHSHLKDRATQLLIKYKSGALVTQKVRNGGNPLAPPPLIAYTFYLPIQTKSHYWLILNWYLKTFRGYLFGFCLVSYPWMSLLIIFVWFTLKVRPWINYFLFHEDNIWDQCRLYLELYEMIQMIPLRSYMVGW